VKAHNTSREPILFIFDGYGSHLSERLHQLAMANNIHILCLPPHTTHCLQPLNVGIFGLLGNAFSRCCDEVLQETGEEILIQDFVKEYMHACTDAFKSETIKKAFKNSGICTLKPDVFTDVDYAPSIPSLIHAHTPPSYPMIPTLLTPQNHATDDNSDHDSNPDESDSDDSDNDQTDNEQPNTPNLAEQQQTNMDPTPSTCTVERLESTSQCKPIHHLPSVAGPATQPLDPPPMPTLSNTHQRPQQAVYINPNWTKKRKLEVTTSEMEWLLAEIAHLREQLNASNTHCTMAMLKARELKRKLNVKEGQKKKSMTVDLGAHWTTSGEGLVQFDANIKAQKEKKAKEALAKAVQEQAAVTSDGHG
jgi:hypothetical protein